jgi:hypothetical protein
MSRDAAILQTISMLARDGFFILTEHATEQRIERRMSTTDVEDILCNPSRIIRTDIVNEKEKYKIEGGAKKQRLAITITDDKLIVVITAMD